MKFSAWLLFTVLWVTFVYFPLAHMVWGKGGWFNWALGGKIPVLDFAGGTVVHISSGVSALVCALVLGKRLGYPREPRRISRPPLPRSVGRFASGGKRAGPACWALRPEWSPGWRPSHPLRDLSPSRRRW